MIAIDNYGDLVDEAIPPPFWSGFFWLVVVILLFDGCMRRGV